LSFGKCILFYPKDLCVINNEKYFIMKKVIIVFNFLLIAIIGCSQTPTQTIRGVIVDKDSKSPLGQASIMLDIKMGVMLDVYANKNGVTSDSNGVFILQNVAVGRHALEISLVGYKPQYISDIQLNSAKA
jgi:hypothetical protein